MIRYTSEIILLNQFAKKNGKKKNVFSKCCRFKYVHVILKMKGLLYSYFTENEGIIIECEILSVFYAFIIYFIRVFLVCRLFNE